jgi:hypothetical protein
MTTKQFNKIKMTQLTSMFHVVSELRKGKYIIFADKMPLQCGVDILTQDVLYYDKKNKRFRFMLAKNWTSDKLLIYPVRSMISKEGLKDYNNVFLMNNLYFDNYDIIYSAESKYINVILDDYKDSSFNF